MIYQRILAILILCIPGAIGVLGWKWMREAFFNYAAGDGFSWLLFIGGGILFLFGLFFVGGFLFYRDEKRNNLQPMLRRKKKKSDKYDPSS